MPLTGNELRLPKTTQPKNYNLTLEPDLAKFSFKGNVSIEINVEAKTNSIQLNSSELTIASVALASNNLTITPSFCLDEETETLTLSFVEDINPGYYNLNIEFIGTLNDKLRGFYRSQYTNPEGDVAYLATTQFEATDARKAFPCWDEPDTKATFDINLIVPSNLTALSNMPEKSVSELPIGLKNITFEQTPLMSTYLLAFIIGDLSSIESLADNDTTMRIWTTRGKENQAGFALETATSLLKYFNEYFGIPFPLPKLDHIAIPDFAAGAMENWGAITYRETALLVDPDNSSAGTKQRVAEVIAHEMAHMWFGDLVTMEWWDDLWLNESFASWMGNKAVDWLFPEWEMWTQFVNMDTNRAFTLDGLKNSHPIEQTVENPAEVSQLFDAISYSKGGSVLRMLEQFLGPDIFQEGLHLYLSNNKYSNARTAHLWQALETSSGKPVTRIMDTWTSQTGYPVISIQRSNSGINTLLDLHQTKFTYDSILKQTSSPDPALWEIPVSIIIANSTQLHSDVMDKQTHSVDIGSVSSDKWIKLNSEVSGFYRVNYQSSDWNLLKSPISTKELSASDRLEVQNDAYALSRSGQLPINIFLDIAECYKKETDATVWSDLATNLKEIEQLIIEKPYHEQYRAFGKEMFSSITANVGWNPKPNEGHLSSLLRSIVLSQSGGYGDEATISNANSLFEQYQSSPELVSPDIRGIIFSLVAQNGTDQTYNTLWNMEKSAELQEEKIRILLSMARFKQPEILNDLLIKSISDQVRSQDTISVIGSVANNPFGKRLAWEFLKSNWSTLDERYGGGGFGLMRLVSITGGFASQEDHDDVESFFTTNSTPAAERSVRQSLERIRLNTEWVNTNHSILTGWLG